MGSQGCDLFTNRTIFCSRSHLFLSQWEWDSKTKQPVRFQGYFNITNKISEIERQKATVLRILQLQINAKTVLLLSPLFQNLINYSFWMMIMSSFRLKTYFTRSFQHSVSILTNIFFLQHLLKIRIIPSPVTHKQTKTTQQQIHSHLKKVHVSRFPVVSNKAIQDLNPSSAAVNKHT